MLVFAASVAVASPQPSLPPCVSDEQIQAHIDPRLPAWMRVEIHAVMLSLPPCARRGTVGADDSQGRFITNNYDDYLEYRRKWGGDWVRVNSEFWRAPSGDLVKMPYEPVPRWLLGRWSCTGKDAPPIVLVLRPNSSGEVRSVTTNGAVNPQGKFVEFPAPAIPIQIFAYRSIPPFGSTIYAGMKNGGFAYSVEHAPLGLAIREWGFFRDNTWNAMPTQPQWLCKALR